MTSAITEIERIELLLKNAYPNYYNVTEINTFIEGNYSTTSRLLIYLYKHERTIEKKRMLNNKGLWCTYYRWKNTMEATE